MTEADECTCGRYHSASEWTCYKCGKLVLAKQPKVVGISGACACIGPQNGEAFCPCEMRRNEAMQAQTKRVSIMDEAKAYVISDSQEMLNFYKQTWNVAIEDAALELEKTCWNGTPYAEEIRKLKK